MVYTKVEGTDPDDLIAVDADGNLSVNKNLDREKSNGQIKFQVKVRDWPTTTNPSMFIKIYRIDFFIQNYHF